MRFIALITAIAMTGCGSEPEHHGEPACERQCLDTYSKCLPAVGGSIMRSLQCENVKEQCLKTC